MNSFLSVLASIFWFWKRFDGLLGLLVKEEKITSVQAWQILEKERKQGVPTIHLLVEMGLINKVELNRIMRTRAVGILYLPNDSKLFLDELGDLAEKFGFASIKELFLRNYLIPIGKSGLTVTFAVADPLDARAFKAIYNLMPEKGFKIVWCDWTTLQEIWLQYEQMA